MGKGDKKKKIKKKGLLGLKRRKRFASPRPTGLGWGPLIIYACPIRLTLFRTSNAPLLPVGPTLTPPDTTQPLLPILSFYLFFFYQK